MTFNFGVMTQSEAIDFLNELELEHDVDLKHYIEKVMEADDMDDFELTHTGEDEDMWTLANIDEYDVIIDHQLLDLETTGDE